MRNILAVGLVLAGMLMAGCDRREKDEPQREPGSFLRPGGDVVIGG